MAIERTSDQGKKRNPQEFLTSPTVINTVVSLYLILLVILLVAELGLIPGLEQYFRATNQVLVLLALFFLPFLIIASGKVVRSVSLKLSGQEVHLELSEAKQVIQAEVKRVEAKMSGQVGTVEQAIWPMLAGKDPTCESRWQQPQVIIGSKEDASQVFFAHLLAVWLEREIPHINCTARVPNGGSLKNFADIKNNWIDLYIDFTGTCCHFFNLPHQNKTRQQLVDELNIYGEPLGLEWLKMLGASEDYCLAMRKSVADQKNIKSLRDLSMVADQLVFSADPEFLNRNDCYIGLAAQYDLKFRRIEPCNVIDRYAMFRSGEADVFGAYETDPEIYTQDLIVLEDVDHFFPSYDAIPLVSKGAMQAIPGLRAALEKLAGIITTAELVDQVHKIRKRGSHPGIAREIAESFLRAKSQQ